MYVDSYACLHEYMQLHSSKHTHTHTTQQTSSGTHIRDNTNTSSPATCWPFRRKSCHHQATPQAHLYTYIHTNKTTDFIRHPHSGQQQHVKPSHMLAVPTQITPPSKARIQLRRPRYAPTHGGNQAFERKYGANGGEIGAV